MATVTDKRKKKLRDEAVSASADEFIFRVGLIRLKEPKFDALAYMKQFCHERCITEDELLLAVARVLLERI